MEVVIKLYQITFVRRNIFNLETDMTLIPISIRFSNFAVHLKRMTVKLELFIRNCDQLGSEFNLEQ